MAAISVGCLPSLDGKDPLAEDTVHSMAGHREVRVELALVAVMVLGGDVQAAEEVGCL